MTDFHKKIEEENARLKKEGKEIARKKDKMRHPIKYAKLKRMANNAIKIIKAKKEERKLIAEVQEYKERKLAEQNKTIAEIIDEANKEVEQVDALWQEKDRECEYVKHLGEGKKCLYTEYGPLICEELYKDSKLKEITYKGYAKIEYNGVEQIAYCHTCKRMITKEDGKGGYVPMYEFSGFIKNAEGKILLDLTVETNKARDGKRFVQVEQYFKPLDEQLSEDQERHDKMRRRIEYATWAKEREIDRDRYGSK